MRTTLSFADVPLPDALEKRIRRGVSRLGRLFGKACDQEVRVVGEWAGSHVACAVFLEGDGISCSGKGRGRDAWDAFERAMHELEGHARAHRADWRARERMS